MRLFGFFPAFFFLAALMLPAQENSVLGTSPYLIPQTVFVGDRGRLVVPLGRAFVSAPPFVSTAPENLFKAGGAAYPRDENGNTASIVLSRIELEQRGGSPRLLVDFVPYVTGVITFPALVIPGANSLEVSGLRITVASILKPHEASLSGFASPLPAPGTGLLIYSAFALVLGILFLCVCGGFWYKNHFASFKIRRRRRHLLRAMDKLLVRFKAESLKTLNLFVEGPAGGNYEELFSILSGEFREFLSLFTGLDCRALTPGEFASLDLPSSETVSRDYLFELFSRWELIRFGGKRVLSKDFFAVLEEMRSFIKTLDTAERSAKNGSPEQEGRKIRAEMGGASA